MLAFVLQGAIIGVSAALSPGPFQSLIIANSLIGGWRRAAPMTFAPLLVDLPVAVVFVFMISQVPAGFLSFVEFAGAALMIYLAINLWREIRSTRTADKSTPTTLSRRNAFFQGVAMLLLSPGPYLFWALINGPILLKALAQSWLHALAFLLAFYFVSIGGLLVIAYVVGRVGEFNHRVRRRLQYASLVLIVSIAALLAYNGFRG